MISRKLIVILCICIVFILTGCSGAALADEDRIIEDISNYDDLLGDDESISEVKIAQRRTEEEKSDLIWVEVATQDEKASYEKQFALEYSFDDGAGWILETVAPDNEYQWKSTALAGISVEEIEEILLQGYNIRINNDMWTINPETLVEIHVSNQTPDIENQEDSATVSITLESDIQTASGQIDFDYEYNNGWQIADSEIVQEFVAEYKPGNELDTTSSKIIAEIANGQFAFGSGFRQQNITISGDEVSDFSITSDISENFGIKRTLQCHFMLNKKAATLSIDSQIQYMYGENGWVINGIEYAPEIVSVNLLGEWNGKYTASQGDTRMVLDVTDMDADGNFSAIFSFSALPSNPSVPSGSYSMKGNIQFDDLDIVLEGSEWIEQPETYIMLDFEGRLYVEDCKISHTGGYAFEITK